MPFTSSVGSLNRAPDSYSAVLKQFQVDTAPRYQPSNGETFCATFATDVALALGVVLPTVWGANGGVGTPIGAPSGGGFCRLMANDLADWLASRDGLAFGWVGTNESDAMACAIQGHPTLAVWKNPNGGHGHIAWLLPVAAAEPMIAQAGEHCGYMSLSSGFGQLPVEYFTHP
jgi:hypothetical protein